MIGDLTIDIRVLQGTDLGDRHGDSSSCSSCGNTCLAEVRDEIYDWFVGRQMGKCAVDVDASKNISRRCGAGDLRYSLFGMFYST